MPLPIDPTMPTLIALTTHMPIVLTTPTPIDPVLTATFTDLMRTVPTPMAVMGPASGQEGMDHCGQPCFGEGAGLGGPRLCGAARRNAGEEGILRPVSSTNNAEEPAGMVSPSFLTKSSRIP